MNEPDTISLIIALVVGIFVIILVGFWVLFPVIIWQQLKELNKIAVDIHNLLAEASRDIQLMANLAIPHPLEKPPIPDPVVPMPNAPSYKCEFCEAVIEYEDSQSGTTAPCPNCGNEINLP